MPCTNWWLLNYSTTHFPFIIGSLWPRQNEQTWRDRQCSTSQCSRAPFVPKFALCWDIPKCAPICLGHEPWRRPAACRLRHGPAFGPADQGQPAGWGDLLFINRKWNFSIDAGRNRARPEVDKANGRLLAFLLRQNCHYLLTQTAVCRQHLVE